MKMETLIRLHDIEMDERILSLHRKISPDTRSLIALRKLQLIIDDLNEGYNFDLSIGDIGYPVVRFYNSSLPTREVVLEKFWYKGEVYNLTSRCIRLYHVSHTVDLIEEFGLEDPTLFCKNVEVASYVAENYPKLLFEANYIKYLEVEDFYWMENEN